MQNDYLNNKKFYSENNDNYAKPKIQHIFNSKKVDVNKLLNRVKIEKKEDIKKNWILAGLIISVVSIIGIVIIL